jgi:putative glutamine amidotransferase
MDDYRTSVERAGGVPVELEAADIATLSSLPDHVDAVVLTGGGDVDPALYGQTPHPLTRVVPSERDRFELAVARLCLSEGLPLLAICRGLQVMNVACGGTLVQDIPDQVRNALPHQDATTPTSCPHDIELVPDTILARCLARQQTTPTRIRVNSRHHQAIDAIGRGLRLAAFAPDGVIEAVEADAHPFAIGVQWHPENFVEGGEFRGLFSACIAAAVDWRRRRSG